jgi:hypothetical protein
MFVNQKISKNTKMIKIALFFIFVFCFGCYKPKDDALSMQRRIYTGNELRTNGYYYRNEVNPERIVVLLLYQNGIIRTCGSPSSFHDFENRIDSYNTSTSKSYKNGWGVFVVEDDVFKYEMWRGARALEPYHTRVYKGKILNDTTFHITESYRPNGKEKSEEDLIFHFRQFSPKPDSTNNFIP